MSRHQVEITVEDGGHRVTLDGADITNSISRADLALRPGRPAQLTIEVDLIDVTTFSDADTQVVLGDGHEALVALGWTPPKAGA